LPAGDQREQYAAVGETARGYGCHLPGESLFSTPCKFLPPACAPRRCSQIATVRCSSRVPRSRLVGYLP
jgi:hypothetical protein